MRKLCTALVLLCVVVVGMPGVALADPTVDPVWTSVSVGDANDPPTSAELLDMETAAATSKTCAVGTWRRGYDSMYYAIDADGGLVPVVEISHLVKWTGNCAAVLSVTQTESYTFFVPGFQWEGWDPMQVVPTVGKTSHVTATISGSYASCPEGLTCVDNHHPFSSVVLYANGRSTETHGDTGAATGVGVSTDVLPEIVPNVG